VIIPTLTLTLTLIILPLSLTLTITVNYILTLNLTLSLSLTPKLTLKISPGWRLVEFRRHLLSTVYVQCPRYELTVKPDSIDTSPPPRDRVRVSILTAKG
jgi:hypothetical protein